VKSYAVWIELHCPLGWKYDLKVCRNRYLKVVHCTASSGCLVGRLQPSILAVLALVPLVVLVLHEYVARCQGRMAERLVRDALQSSAAAKLKETSSSTFT